MAGACGGDDEDAGGEGHEGLEAAAVERKILDEAAVDDGADAGVDGVDLLAGAVDFDLFGLGAELELDVFGELAADFDDEVVEDLCAEAGGGDAEGVGAGFELGEGVEAGGVGVGGEVLLGLLVEEVDLGVGDDGGGGIPDDSGDLSALGEGGEGGTGKEESAEAGEVSCR